MKGMMRAASPDAYHDKRHWEMWNEVLPWSAEGDSRPGAVLVNEMKSKEDGGMPLVYRLVTVQESAYGDAVGALSTGSG